MAVDPLKELKDVTSDARQQTQPEMLKNPAVPVDYAVNMGFRIVNQYLKRLSDYVMGPIRVSGLNILSTANNNYQIAAGELMHQYYILEQAATETLDISTDFPSDGSDTGILFLHITEKRFKSDDATVTPGSNKYGNIDPANDLRINAGSWYDTHNEWRFKFEWEWNTTSVLPTDSENAEETQLERYVKIADLEEVGSGVMTTDFVMATITKNYHEILAYAIDHESRVTQNESDIASKGVTNGDSHDHNGGDGGTISHLNLSNVGSNAHSVIDTHLAAVALHRQINDSGTSATELWSASKINTELAGKAPSSEGVTNGNSHDHNGGDGATISHLNLSNVGTRTHTELDTHISSTVNQASSTARGHTEHATISETSTGTDQARSVTPDSLAGSIYGEKSVCIVPFESDIAPAVGDGKVAFTVPASMDGMNLVAKVASCYATGSGTITIQVRRRRSGSNSNMLSVAMTLTNQYSVSDGTINTTLDDIDTGDQIYIDIDGATATLPTGLSVTLTFRRP